MVTHLSAQHASPRQTAHPQGGSGAFGFYFYFYFGDGGQL